MSNHIYLRMLGYGITIPLHMINLVVMTSSFKGEVLNDPIVYHYSQMQIFFFTGWNFVFQIVFAAFSLYYDVQTLNNSHTDYKPPKIVDSIRREAFTTIIWPSTIAVFCIFWLFFAYDRNLLYPSNIDLAISDTSNHVMHTLIVPIALWELMFYHRSKPKSIWWRLLITWTLEIIYIATLLYVHEVYGVWVYPVFGKLYNSQLFSLFFIVIAMVLASIHYMQWYLYSLLWGSRLKVSEKTC